MSTLAPKSQTDELRKLLTDLYELLEAYAPAWYSRQLHERLLAALKMLDTQGRLQNDG